MYVITISNQLLEMYRMDIGVLIVVFIVKHYAMIENVNFVIKNHLL